MMMVREAAEMVGRDPSTIRRWIRSGRLRTRKLGTLQLIEEADLVAAIPKQAAFRLPAEWARTAWGTPMPNVVAAVRRSRASR